MSHYSDRPPARWAHGLLWWPRTAINNVVFCLVESLSLFLYCLSEIKFTTTTTYVIMGMMASQFTSLMVVYSTIYSGADQRKHQSSASVAFVRGIHR